MHSSHLRGSDFELIQDGRAVQHETYFESFTITDRLGLVTAQPFDGLGAAALVMGYVTAFYARYRAAGDDFLAYPDFFSFQRLLPLARYGMFDIWPDEKNVHLPEEYWDKLSTIASRAISIMIVPAYPSSTMEAPVGKRERAILESLRRSVRVCYAYSPEGSVEDGNLTVCCANERIREWGTAVVETIPERDHSETHRMWDESFTNGSLTQSFNRIGLDDALTCFADSRF